MPMLKYFYLHLLPSSETESDRVSKTEPDSRFLTGEVDECCVLFYSLYPWETGFWNYRSWFSGSFQAS